MNASTGRKRYRLLIIDDNRAIHDDFRKILAPDSDLEQLNAFEAELFGRTIEVSNRHDFELDSAYQGEQGLELVRASLDEGRPYSLAFVDMRMPPGWNGIETIERIWQHDPALQVVICSAYSDHSWAEISKRLDNSDRLLILKKPFDNVEILQMAYAMSRKCEMARGARRAGLDDVETDEDELIGAIRTLGTNFRALMASLNTLNTRLAVIAGKLEGETPVRQLLSELGAASDIQHIEALEGRLPELLGRLESTLERHRSSEPAPAQKTGDNTEGTG